MSVDAFAQGRNERLNDSTKKSSRNIGLEHSILSLFSKRRTSVNERKNWEIGHDNEFGRKRPRALTIYIIDPGGNFRCKYSVLWLVQTQNGNTTKNQESSQRNEKMY